MTNTFSLKLTAILALATVLLAVAIPIFTPTTNVQAVWKTEISEAKEEVKAVQIRDSNFAKCINKTAESNDIKLPKIEVNRPITDEQKEALKEIDEVLCINAWIEDLAGISNLSGLVWIKLWNDDGRFSPPDQYVVNRDNPSSVALKELPVEELSQLKELESICLPDECIASNFENEKKLENKSQIIFSEEDENAYLIFQGWPTLKFIPLGKKTDLTPPIKVENKREIYLSAFPQNFQS